MSEDVREPQPPDAAGARRRPRLRSSRAAGACPAPCDTDVPLRLVREYKGPTVRTLLSAPPAAVARFPGRVCSVLEAIDRGDLADAERRLDTSFNVVPGPGHAPRTPWRVLWPWLLGLWGFAALATAVALTGA